RRIGFRSCRRGATGSESYPTGCDRIGILSYGVRQDWNPVPRPLALLALADQPADPVDPGLAAQPARQEPHDRHADDHPPAAAEGQPLTEQKQPEQAAEPPPPQPVDDDPQKRGGGAAVLRGPAAVARDAQLLLTGTRQPLAHLVLAHQEAFAARRAAEL